MLIMHNVLDCKKKVWNDQCSVKTSWHCLLMKWTISLLIALVFCHHNYAFKQHFFYKLSAWSLLLWICISLSHIPCRLIQHLPLSQTNLSFCFDMKNWCLTGTISAYFRLSSTRDKYIIRRMLILLWFTAII